MAFKHKCPLCGTFTNGHSCPRCKWVRDPNRIQFPSDIEPCCGNCINYKEGYDYVGGWAATKTRYNGCRHYLLRECGNEQYPNFFWSGRRT